jgi:hypothetical protein
MEQVGGCTSRFALWVHYGVHVGQLCLQNYNVWVKVGVLICVWQTGWSMDKKGKERKANQ